MKDVTFVKSIMHMKDYPDLKKPEVAFIGKSNVGKSSLINSLTNRKNLAKTSQTPGRTRTINFFSVDNSFTLVDLPGYGFHQASKGEEQQWTDVISEFLTKTPNMRLLCYLFDIRRTPNSSDYDAFRWFLSTRIPMVVVLTKSDKVSGNARAKSITSICNAFGIEKSHVYCYSAQTNYGREKLIATMSEVLEVPIDSRI